MPRVPALDELLTTLARPSISHWRDILRELARHFGRRVDAATHPLGHLWSQLDAPRRDLAAVLGLYRRIKNGPDGAAGGDTTCRLLDLLDVLVRYRNEVFGHGAVRQEPFYEALGPLLFAAANDVLGEGVLDLLGPPGTRLVYLTELRTVAEERVEASLVELVGLRSERLEPLGLTGAQAAGLVPNRVALLWPGHRVPLRLDPLLVFRERVVGEEVLFLNCDRKGQRAEYLGYNGGEPEQDAEMARALAPLLSRIVDRTVEPDEVDQLADVSGLGLPPSAGPAPTGRVLGDYELLAQLGRGGMGVVYLARQLSLGRTVALKLLPAELAGDEVSLARFRREIRALARCDHPHIVKVLASGTLPDGQLYYSMEYVPGADLEQVWQELSGEHGHGAASSLGSSTWARAVRSASQKQRQKTAQRADSPSPGPGTPESVGQAFQPDGQPGKADVREDAAAGSPASLSPRPGTPGRGDGGEGPRESTQHTPCAEPALAQASLSPVLRGEGGGEGPLDSSRHTPCAESALGESGLRDLPLPPLPELPAQDDDPGGYARRVAELIRDAALALQAVHEQGIVHRDVKPGNLMLTPDGRRVVLMDFGLAKGRSLSLTTSHAGGFLGTLRYAAPEQLAAATLKVGPPADVRALGGTLWELLTRQQAFGEARDETQLATLVHDRDLPRLRAVDPTLDADLEAIVARATERAVADRIQTARELAEYLDLYLAGQPLPIRPPGVGELLWRWVRQHAALVATVATAILAIVMAFAISFALVTKSRNDAIEAKGTAEELAASEAEAKRQADQSNLELMRQLGRNLIERGAAECATGHADRGVALFSHAYAQLSEACDPLAVAALGLMAGWSHALGIPLRHESWVTAVCFSPDGRAVLTRSGNTARLWDVPRPITEYPQRARLWSAVRTGWEVDANSALRRIPVAEWFERWQSLAVAESAQLDALKAEAERTRILWHRGQATESESKGQWLAAAFHWTQLLKQEPSNPEFLRRRGAAYRHLGRPAEAQTDLSRAVEVQPSDAAAWNERGHVNAELGQWREAAADFAKTRDLLPSDSTGWCWLGYAQVAGGELSGYRKTCQEMLARFSETEDATAATNVAWLAAFMPAMWPAEPEKSTLVRLARLARKSDSRDANALENLGDVLYRVGQLSEAEQCLKEAAEKKGDEVPASACFFLAMTYHQLGRADDARTWLEKGIAQSEKETDWDKKVVNQLLRQEAETLLKSPAKPPADPAPEAKPPVPK